MGIKRIFVEKKPGFDVEAQKMKQDLTENLLLSGVTNVRVINRYDVEGITDEEYAAARNLIFSEPPVDVAMDEAIDLPQNARTFAVEYLPGQFDQRADSAAQCIQILTAGEKPVVKSARIYVIEGDLTDGEFDAVMHHTINPVEAREAAMEKPISLETPADVPADIVTIDGFITADGAGIKALAERMGFAMDLDDLKFCQEYFRDTEKRDPTFTELRVIDTYWSDHCRHTTFSTILEDVAFEEGKYAPMMESVYQDYQKTRADLGRGEEKPECLMDLGTIGAKALKSAGKLQDLDESEEINACSIRVPITVNGKEEEYLVMFKNETHNHPTEIEPFGGAATCLGGAIRDPLSGRSYVYQAMRVTGSGDPRQKVEDTMKGKLPQRTISTTAAAGYSSYGNQIGLATGQVVEIYDDRYAAKRMEIGAVIGAAPKRNVIREVPQKGDVIILLGGRTGRDGCGGATGSSKAHTDTSLSTCGAEVQKGNPPEERKIQRLFRKEEVTRLIKRCNDFGAGGVSVAIGELADGLTINLDAVPKKYDGLDGTELAISESQERMAVVVAAKDVETFIAYASDENLEATVVATVTDENRLLMNWRGNTIVNLSRDFLNTNGAKKYAKVEVVSPKEGIFQTETQEGSLKEAWLKTLGKLNVACQKGLAERFDASIGAGSVLMPFGGKYQWTPTEGMAGKIPVLDGDTDAASIMTFGYHPGIATKSPFHGAVYAVVESAAKIAAMGGDYKKARLTFQEYFERLGTDPKRWGKPFSALLGAYWAQMKLGLPAIGGKDSMSGSFNDLDVPPTLVSFAVAVEKADKVLSPEFKSVGNKLYLLSLPHDENELPDFDALDKIYSALYRESQKGTVVSASVLKEGGLARAVSEMAFGNMLGADLTADKETLFALSIGSILVEATDAVDFNDIPAREVGVVTDRKEITAAGETIALADALKAWTTTFRSVYPIYAREGNNPTEEKLYTGGPTIVAHDKFAAPRVFIPVFPGNNCEYDSQKAFLRAGAKCDVFVIKNLSSKDIMYSMEEMKKRIDAAQIIMIPGGFSGGDEPDGSGKFIATAFRNPKVKEATMNLLNNRDGLMLGICNGFQALIKLGLVPYGEIRDITEQDPTLTFNTIGRHISCMAYTKVVSNLSPWLSGCKVGDVHAIPISHGEGRFVANESVLNTLTQNGQIATQYVTPEGSIALHPDYNFNGSFSAIEGITSPDGRVLGKMGHSERQGESVARNIPADQDQKIFESGVRYFK